jgi:hypothetical protein
MADQKISQLNELTSPLSGDTLPIVNNGETKKITVDNLLSGSNVRDQFISTHTTDGLNIKLGSNGAWIGDGGVLDTVQITGILNPEQGYIRFGSGSVSPRIGHTSEDANTLTVEGFLRVNDPVLIGSGSLVSGNPEMIRVYSSGSYNIANFLGNTETYSQINVKNNSSAAGSSSDIVATADNGDENLHYVNMGINSSGFDTPFSIGYQNDAYVYNAGRDLYIGTLDAVDNNHGHVHIFTSNSWESPQISVLNNQQIGFNTSGITSGYTYEFSGSVKFDNLISLTPVNELPTGSTLGDMVVSGSNLYFHNGSNWNSVNLTSV